MNPRTEKQIQAFIDACCANKSDPITLWVTASKIARGDVVFSVRAEKHTMVLVDNIEKIGELKISLRSIIAKRLPRRKKAKARK